MCRPLAGVGHLIDPDCQICFGLGWVCENHPFQPWDEKGCQCGAGMPCECQQATGLEELDVSKVIARSPTPKTR
ncbi:hypothetical protein EAS54_31130 [Bradyrhizobium guangzhouense]|nr:hypothetical protein EAS54_31130 [Bradyrhizobium guangzhouense]